MIKSAKEVHWGLTKKKHSPKVMEYGLWVISLVVAQVTKYQNN